MHRNWLYRLVKHIQHAGSKVFKWLEGLLNAVFGPENNPLYYLGGLTFFFLYILIISGVYVYIFYDTEVSKAYASVEYMTHGQWYLAGVMRSLHRYASDAMIVTMILHMLRRFFNDRYNGARSFSWITGIPMLWLVFLTGLLGYWLVWDQLAQFIAVRTFEWIDWLPIIAEPTARNFLNNETVTDTFFRLILVTHLGLPLFLGAAMLLHTNRLHHPKINPPRRLALGTLAALLVLSFIKPAVSHGPADLAVAPSVLHFDWFYLVVYYLMGILPLGVVWVLVGGGTIFAFLLPWLPPKPREPAAEVHLDHCSGCNLCVADCPYEAIRLEPRSDGHRRFTHEARVDASKCVSCGICTGSCPFSTPFRHEAALKTGIEMPHAGIQGLRAQTLAALEKMRGEKKVLAFGCAHAVDMHELSNGEVTGIGLECTGMLPPSFVDFALRKGADGVFVTGCRMGDCYHRLGNQWMEQRLADERKPELHRKVDRDRVHFHLAAETDKKKLVQAVEAFRRSLPPGAPSAHTAGRDTREEKKGA